jgi:acyl-CoA synthetase (AMP-forming)/AMP-acid ligase II
MAQSVYQLFLETANQYAGNPFLHIPAIAATGYSDSAIDISYEEARRQVQTLKSEYAGQGYGRGHRVAILLENRPAFFLHWFALNGLGVSVVPVNGEMTLEEQAYILEQSDACVVVSVDGKVSQLQRAVELMEEPIQVVGVTALDQMPVPNEPAATNSEKEDSDTSKAECAMLYTSGSTGKPKGCLLSNEYFLLMGEWYRDLGGVCKLVPGKERLLTPLPLVHMNAMSTSTMGMLATGGCIIQLDRFHPRSWWDTVRDSRATALHYLGVMPAILLHMEATDEDDISSQIKFGFGAGVNPKHHAPFEERFGFPLAEGWAMTETGAGGIIFSQHEPRKVGTSCIGRPKEATEVMLVDESGVEVPFGAEGELLVRASGDDPKRGYFSGYYRNQEETDKTWAGGWLHTGDVVRQSEDGQYHFVDRRKNVIRRSGENISALEVEAALVLDERIAATAVTAVPDEMRGDEVMACIILESDYQADFDTAKSIFERCGESLVYYKVPGYISFVDELPLTASQKPQRGEIKLLARGLVEQGKCHDLRDFKRRTTKKAG